MSPRELPAPISRFSFARGTKARARVTSRLDSFESRTFVDTALRARAYEVDVAFTKNANRRSAISRESQSDRSYKFYELFSMISVIFRVRAAQRGTLARHVRAVITRELSRT